MRQGLEISERRACGPIGMARTTVRRVVGETEANEALKVRMVDLADARRRFGYRRIHDLLRREGVLANYKRVYRLYREANLSAGLYELPTGSANGGRSVSLFTMIKQYQRLKLGREAHYDSGRFNVRGHPLGFFRIALAVVVVFLLLVMVPGILIELARESAN